MDQFFKSYFPNPNFQNSRLLLPCLPLLHHYCLEPSSPSSESLTSLTCLTSLLIRLPLSPGSQHQNFSDSDCTLNPPIQLPVTNYSSFSEVQLLCLQSFEFPLIRLFSCMNKDRKLSLWCSSFLAPSGNNM